MHIGVEIANKIRSQKHSKTEMLIDNIRQDPTTVNICFVDGVPVFSFKYHLNYPHEAEWTRFQSH
jgi:hypothetical protein